MYKTEKSTGKSEEDTYKVRFMTVVFLNFGPSLVG